MRLSGVGSDPLGHWTASSRRHAVAITDHDECGTRNHFVKNTYHVHPRYWTKSLYRRTSPFTVQLNLPITKSLKSIQISWIDSLKFDSLNFRACPKNLNRTTAACFATAEKNYFKLGLRSTFLLTCTHSVENLFQVHGFILVHFSRWT